MFSLRTNYLHSILAVATGIFADFAGRSPQA